MLCFRGSVHFTQTFLDTASLSCLIILDKPTPLQSDPITRTMIFVFSTFLSLLLVSCRADPLARLCEESRGAGAVCVERNAAVLPLPFTRDDGDPTSTDDFPDTILNTTSLDLIKNATFTAFHPRAIEALGEVPKFEIMFVTEPDKIQEAPVFVPELNAIIFSVLSPDTIPQRILRLNDTMPTISTLEPSPAVWGVNGGRYHNGTVYWAVVGEGSFQDSSNVTVRQAPGIYALDPITMESRPLLNNYYGAKFNSPDDLVVDTNGDIFFTDPC